MIDKMVLKNDLHINQSEINEELARQASLYAYYSEQGSLLNEKVSRLKLSLEVFEAALDGKLRDHATARREKLTEVQIEKAMRRNDEWVRRREQLIEAQTSAEQINGLVKAFAHKKDMLIALANNMRQERAIVPNFRAKTGDDIPTIPAQSAG